MTSYRCAFTIVACKCKSGDLLNQRVDVALRRFINDMAMEALIHGTYRLFVHLTVLFNLCINVGYLPNGFMQSLIIPLVKNKSGDLSDLNNYRAIALSPVLSLSLIHI